VSRTPPLSFEALADLCFAHLVEQPELLLRFMGVAGYSPQSLRAAAGSRHLNIGIIDYFAENEGLLLAVCERHGLRPEEFTRAWTRLNMARGS
jgi:hypothetical protein